MPNRHARCRAAATKPRRDKAAPLDRVEALRIAAAMIDRDRSVSGATLIEPDGTMTYVDAAMLRRGGNA
jgi:hypothetical protein